MDDLRGDIERAMEKHEHAWRFWFKARAWRGGILPGMKATWRFIVAAGPLWMVVTAVATAVMAYKMIMPN